MSEIKDSAIKLFGKTIQLLHLDDDVVLAKANEQQRSCSEDTKKNPDEEHATTTLTDDTCSINDDPKTPTADNETSSKNPTKKENPVTNSNSEEKPQKPDKILPCPRCNSMDTKFCYYNNYNVNQPRHFCKNCQRYWTAGGTMRNTPVGSGRRKNKSSSSASYYRHLIVSEALQPSWKNNGSVLNFGSNVPVCESMNSTLNFSDKTQKSEDDHSSNSVQKNGVSNLQKYPLQIPCYPPPPWPYPCNFQEFPRIPSPNPAQFRPPTTNIGSSGFPVSFFPTPQYWGCTVQQTPWGVPWVATPHDQNTPHSPLGKHSRDGYLVNSRKEEFSGEKDSESSVLTPKTLRVNDPNAAAKISSWSTLGISQEHGRNSIHKAFKSKKNEKNEVVASSLVNLQANPAAFSRSINFQETS
ncbi:hypothetical protein L2E82_08790 [Cichorium intybus]|uniref:Uncharacterized protein n=1 Tax=Cichorium intybus TaxID=13427 RepID=A0ACB9G6X6_CICIN|nr:hypothetical protein L2E82_08790 [Cichorium intybus]